ncbi:MAG: sugar ABC transporter permease [Chthonomonadales bacterium]|nr:sugar ABC transporter permease [Chthonomonadales bacterium]
MTTEHGTGGTVGTNGIHESHLSHRRPSCQARRDLRNGLLFAAPWLIGFTVFIAYPIAASLYFSFCEYDAIRGPKWVGLDNYRTMLLEDDLFWKSLWNTLDMVAFGLPVGLVASLGIALLLNQRLRGMAFYRTLYYLPSITPIVATSILWLWLLNPQIGLINVLLQKLGVANVPGWLTDPAWSKPALILMGLWGAGGGMVIYLAALQDVPEALMEAALLDGAGALQRFRHVTLPMLSPVILFNLVMGLIGSFQYFTQAYVMTGGGPQDSTVFYALHLFNRAFLDFRMGYASAMAWALFLITLACTALVLRSSARWVYYAGEGA